MDIRYDLLGEVRTCSRLDITQPDFPLVTILHTSTAHCTPNLRLRPEFARYRGRPLLKISAGGIEPFGSHHAYPIAPPLLSCAILRRLVSARVTPHHACLPSMSRACRHDYSYVKIMSKQHSFPKLCLCLCLCTSRFVLLKSGAVSVRRSNP